MCCVFTVCRRHAPHRPRQVHVPVRRHVTLLSCHCRGCLFYATSRPTERALNNSRQLPFHTILPDVTDANSFVASMGHHTDEFQSKHIQNSGCCPVPAGLTLCDPVGPFDGDAHLSLASMGPSRLGVGPQRCGGGSALIQWPPVGTTGTGRRDDVHGSPLPAGCGSSAGRVF